MLSTRNWQRVVMMMIPQVRVPVIMMQGSLLPLMRGVTFTRGHKHRSKSSEYALTNEMTGSDEALVLVQPHSHITYLHAAHHCFSHVASLLLTVDALNHRVMPLLKLPF